MHKRKIILTLVLFWVVFGITFYLIDKHTNNSRCFDKLQLQLFKPSFEFDKSKKYLVVRNYNTEGGFFWCIHNVLRASHYANVLNFSLIVWFDEGFYLETKTENIRKYNLQDCQENWFHYYFQPLGEGDPKLLQKLKSINLKQLPSLKYCFDNNKEKNEVYFYQFDRDAFENMHKIVDGSINFHESWKRCITLRPHIQEKVDSFYKENMFGYTVVGVHYRGTDKMPHADGDEDGPVKYPYQWVVETIKQTINARYAKQYSDNLIKLFICSDENPFVQYLTDQLLKENFLDQSHLLFTDAFRSEANTGGLTLQSHLCKNNDDMRYDCVKYRSLAGMSIHRGYPKISAYKKGEDVLVEVLLLSKCDLFLKSRGNVSSFPKFICPNLQVIDLVDAYTSTQNSN